MRLVLVFSLTLAFFLVGCGAPPAPKPPGAPAPPVPPDPTAPNVVEDTAYTQWANFPVGTTVKRRTVVDSELTPGETVSITVLSLKAKTDRDLVLTSQITTTYASGQVEQNPTDTQTISRYVILPDGVSVEAWGKPKGENGEETLTVLDKPYKCRWYKSKSSTDAGQSETQTWTSTNIPGGLVKSLAKVPAVKETTTIDITELTIPQ